MVADHHHLRHHSLALEYVEAQAVKVADADVIAHARCSCFNFFLNHLLVMELDVILAVYQADLAVLDADEVQEAPEVVDLVDHRELQDHQRKYKLVQIDNSYYLLLRSQV